MRRSPLQLLAWTYAAAALTAAAAAHAVIAGLTRIQSIAGPFATYRHDAINSAIIIALAIGCAIAASAVAGSIAARLRSGSDCFAAAVKSMPVMPVTVSALWIFALQVAALSTIEAIEQTQQFGHPLGLRALLGTTPIIAFAIHAVFACAGAASLKLVMSTTTRTAARIAHAVAPIIAKLFRAHCAPAAQIGALSRIVRIAGKRTPLALRTANRPPPALAAS